jgi:methyl-accepting chemotaxis protein
MLSKAAVEGKLETRADAAKHQGDFRKIVEGVNNTLDAVIGPLNVAASYVDQISKGAIPAKITDSYSGDFNTLKHNLNVCIEAVNNLVTDSAAMSQATVAGNFEARADAARHQGDFRKIVEGLNRVMEVSNTGLNEVVRVLGALSNGDLNEKITAEYQGTFKRLKDDSNKTVERLADIVSQIKVLVEAALRGDFTVRGDADKYQNDFRAMVDGLNSLMQTSDTGLNEVVRVLGALAKGDLTEKITNEYQGTFGRLKDDSNKTVDNLTQIVSQIKESTESITVASKEIASGNTDLSSRTEQQASSLEETASSMEELTSTVKQNAENAKQANQLAAGASEVAVKGGNVVGQVVTTMSSINESSKKIVDIISVIDGIAFQTNILALNAAVEAARAGEQGRGFAVVATEVRTLAQRSAAAAKEIKELIGDSVEKVGAGTKLVDEAGKTMEEIVASVKRVTDIMAEITAASQEQSAGIEQVNTAITQMDEVTQQNAALVEEAAAAAESMEEQAGNLTQAVGLFKLNQQAGRSVVAKPAAKPAAGLPAPAKKVATVTQHPSAKPKAAKAAGGGDEWTEF